MNSNQLNDMCCVKKTPSSVHLMQRKNTSKTATREQKNTRMSATGYQPKSNRCSSSCFQRPMS
jgi:hypothetical protein